MKRIFALTVIFSFGLAFCAFLTAEETSSEIKNVPKLSVGGGTFFVNYISGGGFADFSFLIFNKNYFDLRNHFILRGAGLSDSGGFLTLSEKLSFGGFVAAKFRSYGYIEGGIGFWGNGNKDFFKTPLAYSFGGGGGTDLFLGERNSIFFEAGCLITVMDEQWGKGGAFQIGWRGYF